MALKFPLKCFFLFFKEKNIPKLENKGNPLPPNHTKLTLGAWRNSMETRKPAVNPVRRRRVGWELAGPAPAQGRWPSDGFPQGAGLPGIAPSRGRVEPMLAALAFKAPTPPSTMAQPWEAAEEGFVYSGEALGEPRAGPSWRTCRAAAHTVPHSGVRAKPTLFRNIEAPQSPGWQGGKDWISAPPSLMPACRQGGCESGQRAPPHPCPVPHSHIQEAGPRQAWEVVRRGQ